MEILPTLPQLRSSGMPMVCNGLLACRRIYHFCVASVFSHTVNIILRLLLHNNVKKSLVLANKTPPKILSQRLAILSVMSVFMTAAQGRRP